VSPEALANLLRWFGPEYAIGPGTRQSLLIQPSFDPHLLELWATLAFGATLCVPDRDVPQSIGETIDWWRTRRTTHAILPTPVAELLLDLEWPADLTLRHLFIGGDKLRSRPRWPAPAMHNHYGPAEGTILSTTQPLATYLTDGPPPIGTPIGGVCVGVIGTDGQLLNRGQTGELILGGSNLALGYLSQPDLTTERFIAAPPEFGDHGERVYRTGDKVRMRVNGVLEFLGRLDDQVKISGVRVEPAEVEAALEYAPDVRQAVVVADEAPDRSQLIAFIRPVPGTDPLDVPQLQQLCREWVPEQAVPAEIRIVNDFPRTANGKVDRQSLVHSCRPPTTPTAQHPQDTGVTSLLLGICERILGITGLRPTDNFFELGGNSLASMQLAAAIESTYGVRLKVPHMLRQPNLASMAQYIHESRGKPATNNNAPNSGRSPTLEE
jgi:acyl carrier protein